MAETNQEDPKKEQVTKPNVEITETKEVEDTTTKVTKNQEIKAEEEIMKATHKISASQENPEKFLEEFNWHNYSEGINPVEESKLKEFESLVEENFVDTKDQEVMKGKVTRLTDREAIIDINAKSEGVISLNEFRYNPELKVGDEVDVLVDQQEDKIGQLVISHKKARSILAWDRAIKAYENEEIVNGYVKCRTKGGMIVDVFGIEAFLPGSQIEIKPIRDYDFYVGKTMEFKVVKVNHEFKNIVISHKALIEADLADQKREIMSQLEKGQVIEGVVKNITNYGVFVDLGGVDGLIHITDISWNRITDPSEVLALDEKVKVVILDFDEEKTRIQLGLKQLEPHPWETLDKELKEGDKIKGKISVIVDYGAFVEVSKNVEGLIHVSEMSWSTHLRSAQDFVKVGQEVEAVILSLDREERKMSLGMKQLTPNPWTDITSKYPIGSTHKGIVHNFTNFGVFVELEEGIDGLIYISDLSWTKKIKHPSDFISTSETIDVVVLDINVESRKLSLGHKQTKDNPWNEYEKTYKEGTIHEGELIKIVDKGGIVKFTEEVSGFVPTRFLEKEDGSKIKKGDRNKYKVIEFNKDYKKIVVSHTSIFRESSDQSLNNTSNMVAKNNKQSEKSTLGDFNVLSDLKDEMEK